MNVFGGAFGYYWSRPVGFAAFRGRIVLSDHSALVRLVGETRRVFKQFGIMRDGEFKGEWRIMECLSVSAFCFLLSCL